MFKNIEVTQDLLDYIYNHTHPLHPVQRDILTHNKTLGDIQRMQISEIQGYFLQLIIKINNVKNSFPLTTSKFAILTEATTAFFLLHIEQLHLLTFSRPFGIVRIS